MTSTPFRVRINSTAVAAGRRLLIAVALIALSMGDRIRHVQAEDKQSAWAVQFDELWSRATAAREAGRWAEALAAYTELKQILPYEPSTRYDAALCYVQLGRVDDAFAALDEAVSYGWDDRQGIAEDKGFAALHADERFQMILKHADAVREETILVYVPPAVERTKPTPLIVALHGRGENCHIHLPMWKDAADQLGMVVVVPRGIRTPGTIFNTWDKPDVTTTRNTADVHIVPARQRVDQAIALAARKCTIDDQRIVLAGYSQGGAVALTMLVDEPGRFAGAFTIGTLYKSPGVDRWTQARAARDVRVYLLSGELDRLKSRHSDVAHRELAAAGVTVKYVIAPDVGHEPPDDCVRRQIEGIRHVLDGVPR